VDSPLAIQRTIAPGSFNQYSKQAGDRYQSAVKGVACSGVFIVSKTRRSEVGRGAQLKGFSNQFQPS